MFLTQRRVAFGLQLTVNIGFCGVIIIDALEGYSVLLTGLRIAGLIATMAAMLAYWRGWQYASRLIIPLSILVTALACADGHYDPANAIAFLIPSLFAVVMGYAPWVIIAGVATPLLTFLISGSAEWYGETVFLVLYLVVCAGMALARGVFDNATQQAEEAQARAEASQAHATQQADALVEANRAQQAQLDEQQRLLNLVTALETPAVTLADGVMFAPVVGHIDSRRSTALTARLLEAAHAGRARHVILDISGVAAVDTAVAKTLLDTARALRLLGCRVTLSGISSEVALTLTHQGVGLKDITTVRTPQEALNRL